MTHTGSGHDGSAAPRALAAPPAAASVDSPLPSHLVRLGDTPWAAWRWMALRGAGFPVDGVLALADRESARAADELIAAEASLDEVRQQALEALKGDERLSTIDRRTAVKRIRKGERVECLDEPLGDQIAAAHARLNAAVAAYPLSYRAGRVRAFAHLHVTARDGRFREALIWQNRSALHSGIASLLRGAPDADAKKDRRNGELVAGYIQRYCTKNDTIGFFGPVGWARFEDIPDAIRVSAGDPFVVNRTVGFEVWSMDALAASIAAEKSFQPWVVPLRDPIVSLGNGTACLANRQTIRLSPVEVKVWLACDGARTASELATDLAAAEPRVFGSPVVVYLILEGLRARKLIVWDAAVPIEPRPERTLRGWLARVGDDRLRNASLAKLDEMERSREEVRDAAGDEPRLDCAMQDLENTFTRLTSRAATRTVEGNQAGRTLVYEDCRRNADVAVGPALLDALAPALGLLLASARWLTSACADRFRTRLHELYDELEPAGSGSVEFAVFWTASQEMLFRDRPLISQDIEREFQDKWRAVLGGRTHVESAQIADAVRREFSATRCGWRGGRYQSVDLMLAASGVEQIQAGNYQPVLGELHVGVNTLALASFVGQHPCAQDLFDATSSDLPDPRVVLQFPKWLGTMSRSRPVLFSPRDRFLVASAEPHAVDRARTMALGSLVVERIAAGLGVRSKDDGTCFELTEVFADLMMGTVANSFRVLPRAGRTPRVTLDRVVIHRESWNFDANDLPFAGEMPGVDRFLAVRRWFRWHEMPRHVFVRVPVELKPVYVDFESPFYVDHFARLIRKTMAADLARPTITVTEMLPAPGDAWLPDHQDRRYTSEFRIVMVDLAELS